MATTHSFVSWREFLSQPHKAALALVCLGVWLHAADSLIVATMLPSMVADIGGEALVAWLVALYELGSIVAGAASALVTLRFGLKRPMAVAAAVFGLGCLLSAVSPSMPIVLIGRLLQGMAGGGLVAMAFVAVGSLFPARYGPRALASISMFWGASAFLGPMIGAFFVEYASWRWGFAFFGLQALGLALWIVLRPEVQEADPKAEAGPFPGLRLATLALAVLSVAYAGIDVALVKTSLLLILALALFLAFFWLDDRRGEGRLLPKNALLPTSPQGAALTMIVAFSIGTTAVFTFGPLVMATIFEASSWAIGYVIACISIGWTCAAVSVSGAPQRLDRTLIVTGFSLVTASMAGFLYAFPNGPLWLIALFAFIEGAGFGMAWSYILRLTNSLISAQDQPRFAGAIPTLQRLGIAVGAAYMGIVANAIGLENLTIASAQLVITATLISGVPFILIGIISMIMLVRLSGGSKV